MLNFEIHPFTYGDKEKDIKIRQEWYEQIKNTSKPITLSYVGGYDNWMAVYEHKQISLEELKKIVNGNSYGYFVREKEDKILLKRIESYV